MSDDSTDTDAGAGVPDSDPEHLDPAGDMADLIESGEIDIELADDQSPEELREFVEAAERGELGEVDPGLEATVRIARAMLPDDEQQGESK